MMQLRDTATAFSFNTDDGFCIKIERDLAQAFNICTEVKKLRDIIMITVYNHYMLYKVQENLQVVADANMDCPGGAIDSHISQLFKGIQDLSKMEDSLPSFKPNLEQSVKFILDALDAKFKPLTITGETEVVQSKTIKNLYLTDCTASLPALGKPYSFIQKKMNVYKRSRSRHGQAFVQNKSQTYLSVSSGNQNRLKVGMMTAATSGVANKVKAKVGVTSGITVASMSMSKSKSKTEIKSETKNKSKSKIKNKTKFMVQSKTTTKTEIKATAQNKSKMTTILKFKSMVSQKSKNKSNHKSSRLTSKTTALLSKSKSLSESGAEAEAELEMRVKEGEEIDSQDPEQDLKTWQKKLKEGYDKYDSIPTPDIRMPKFDRTKCKEGQDTFQCMSEFLARIYNRYKCNKRMLKAFYGN